MAKRPVRWQTLGYFRTREQAERFVEMKERDEWEPGSLYIYEDHGVEGPFGLNVSVHTSQNARKRPETGHTGPKKKKRYHLMDKALDALMTPLSYSVGISMLAKEKRKK